MEEGAKLGNKSHYDILNIGIGLRLPAVCAPCFAHDLVCDALADVVEAVVSRKPFVRQIFVICHQHRA